MISPKGFWFSVLIFISSFLFACSLHVSQIESWLPSARGLNLTLAAQTNRTVASAVTTTLNLIDSDTLTPAGTASWVSNVDVNRINSTYQYLLGDGTTNSLSGTVTLAAKSKILLAHQVTIDSAALTIKVDGNVVLNVPQGAAATGWINTEIGTFTAGLHSISIETSDPWPRFAYLDGLIVLPSTNMNSGIQRLGWFEENHPHFFVQGLWALLARPAVYPYTVTSNTGAGTKIGRAHV